MNELNQGHLLFMLIAASILILGFSIVGALLVFRYKHNLILKRHQPVLSGVRNKTEYCYYINATGKRLEAAQAEMYKENTYCSICRRKYFAVNEIGESDCAHVVGFSYEVIK